MKIDPDRSPSCSRCSWSSRSDKPDQSNAHQIMKGLWLLGFNHFVSVNKMIESKTKRQSNVNELAEENKKAPAETEAKETM